MADYNIEDMSDIEKIKDDLSILNNKVDDIKLDTARLSGIDMLVYDVAVKSSSFKDKLDFIEDRVTYLMGRNTDNEAKLDIIVQKLDEINEILDKKDSEDNSEETDDVADNGSDDSEDNSEEVDEDNIPGEQSTDDKIDDIVDELEKEKIKDKEKEEDNKKSSEELKESLNNNLDEVKKGNKSVADRLNDLVKAAKDNSNNLLLIVVGALALFKLLQKGWDFIKPYIQPVIDAVEWVGNMVLKIWEKFFPRDLSAVLARDEANYVKERMPNRYSDEEVQSAVDEYKSAYDAYKSDPTQDNLLNLQSALGNLERYRNQEFNPTQFAEDYETIAADYRNKDPRYKDEDHYDPNNLQYNRSKVVRNLEGELEETIVRQRGIVDAGLRSVGSLSDIGITDSMIHRNASGQIEIYDPAADYGNYLTEDEVRNSNIEGYNNVRRYFEEGNKVGYFDEHGTSIRNKPFIGGVRTTGVDDYLRQRFGEDVPDYLNDQTPVTPISEQPEEISQGAGSTAMVNTSNNVRITNISVNTPETYITYLG